MNIDIFAEHFSELEDPRQASKVVYPLFDVVFLTLCAVIAGCEGWEDIEDFGENRFDWLQEHGFFQTGLAGIRHYRAVGVIAGQRSLTALLCQLDAGLYRPY